MEVIESAHAKSTWTLVGGPTFLISSLILILKMIFFGIQLILIILGDMLEFVIGLTLFPIKAL